MVSKNREYYVMEIALRSRKRKVKKPVERDHYWYDPITQKRLHGRGGRMIFEYDRKQKRSVPRIVDAEEWVWEDSYDDIYKWVQKNNISIVSKVPGKHIIVDVNPQLVSNMEEELYRQGIIYDYDERELNKQTKGLKGQGKWQNSQSNWHPHLPH